MDGGSRDLSKAVQGEALEVPWRTLGALDSRGPALDRHPRSREGFQTGVFVPERVTIVIVHQHGRLSDVVALDMHWTDALRLTLPD